MIKNLLDADENPPPGTKVTIEETIVQPTPLESSEAVLLSERQAETESIFESPATINNTEVSETLTEATIFQTITEPSAEQTKTENKVTNLPQTDFKPESPAETIRKSGLAYAAAITLFGIIVFMLILGWFFDLLVGTSPWGVVGGIVLGAVIGFFQFFRLTSQIIKNKN